MEIHQDLKEFLRLLSVHNVEYMLVGGYAVAYHGYPRYTGDLDIWISISQQNADRMVTVLQEFGFNVDTLKPELFMNPKGLIRLGHEPLRIEILNSVSGLSFQDAWSGREIVTIGESSVPILGLADLRANKQASGRPQDLADLENLPAVEDGLN